MDTNNGTLSFSTAIDTSGLDQGVNHIQAKISGLGDSAAEQTRSMAEEFAKIPKINLDVIVNNSGLDQLDVAFAEIDRVRDANMAGIEELKAKYKELDQAAAEAFMAGDDNKVAEIKQQQAALNELTRARKQAIKEADNQCTSLMALEKKLRAEAAASEQASAGATNFRTRMRELREQLIMMEEAGERGTQAYADLQEEAAKLTDQMGDAAAQARILADDNRGFTGVISGLTGVTGGFQAASSAISLFTGESEDVQKAMLKVQQLMSITMGLQQLQQALNKDSAFMLVTVNKSREYFNKLLAIARGEITAETAAKTANTAAEKANTAAKQGNTGATGTATAAAKADQAATDQDTAAKVRGAKGNLTLAGTFRALGTAIKSVPVFGWIAAAIAVLVAIVVRAQREVAKATKKFKEHQESLKSGREAYAKAAMVIDDYKAKIEKSISSHRDQSKVMEEVRSKFGGMVSGCKTLAEMYDVLNQKSKDYCERMMAEALAQQKLERVVTRYTQAEEARAKVKQAQRVVNNLEKANANDPNRDYLTSEQRLARTIEMTIATNRLKKATDKATFAEKQYEQAVKNYRSMQDRATKLAAANGLDVTTDDTTGTTTTTKADKYDAAAAARKRQQATEAYADKVAKYEQDAEQRITDANLAAQNEGLEKELAQIEEQTRRKQQALEEQMATLVKERRALAKEIYMSQEGATEEGWEQSEGAKKTDADYENEMFEAEPKLREMMYEQDRIITEQGEAAMQAARAKYWKQWVADYGTVEQQIQQINEEYAKKRAEIPATETADYAEMLAKMEEERQAKVSKLLADAFRSTTGLDGVMDNLESLGRTSLTALTKQVREFIANNKLSPEQLEKLNEQLARLEKQAGAGGMFGAIKQSVTDLSAATTAAEQAQREYNDALTSADPARIAAATKQLEKTDKALRQAQQNSLNQAKQTAQATVDIMGKLVTIAESFGADFGGYAEDAMNGVSGLLDALSQVDLLNPFSFVSAAVTGCAAISKMIADIHDQAANDRIEQRQRQIEEFDKSMEQLGRDVDSLYAQDAARNYARQIDIIRQRITLLQAQIEDERGKKGTDEDTIRGYQDEIEEANRQIEELGTAAEDAIFGADLKSAIEDFATAYADAWSAGEDRSRSARDTVRKMMQQMVREAIKAAVQSSQAMESIRQQLKDNFADGIFTAAEQQQVMEMADRLQQELDRQFGWADSLLSNDETRTGATKGIATASQDSVDENNARLTAIQGHTYALNEGLKELNSTSAAILGKVTLIESTTRRTDGTVTQISDTLDRIQRQGIPMQ